MQFIAGMNKKSKISSRPIRSEQVPATSAMLYQMEERLNHKMDARFGSFEGKIESLKHELKEEVHRIGLIVEEQNAKNNYVLDGYSQLYDLIDKRLGVTN